MLPALTVKETEISIQNPDNSGSGIGSWIGSWIQNLKRPALDYIIGLIIADSIYFDGQTCGSRDLPLCSLTETNSTGVKLHRGPMSMQERHDEKSAI
jgi:hypothetical protein